MYEPPLHRQEDLEQVFTLMAAHPLGLLISSGAGGLLANAVPFTRADDGSRFGLLRAHLARANPQGRELTGEVLVVFQGAGHYITPSWYATKRETGKVVPTWNYIAIHASGPLRFFEDKAPLLDIVTRLTQTHEGKRDAPWAVTDAPADYIDTMLKAIVGFELPIAKLEGKWKLRQNKSAADIAGVREGLAAEVDADAAALAKAMPRA